MDFAAEAFAFHKHILFYTDIKTETPLYIMYTSL